MPSLGPTELIIVLVIVVLAVTLAGGVAAMGLGLVGFGRIARHVTRIATGLGMRVSTFDPYLPADAVPAAVVTRNVVPTSGG